MIHVTCIILPSVKLVKYQSCLIQGEGIDPVLAEGNQVT